MNAHEKIGLSLLALSVVLTSNFVNAPPAFSVDGKNISHAGNSSHAVTSLHRTGRVAVDGKVRHPTVTDKQLLETVRFIAKAGFESP